jgi:hypothetical protein
MADSQAEDIAGMVKHGHNVVDLGEQRLVHTIELRRAVEH